MKDGKLVAGREKKARERTRRRAGNTPLLASLVVDGPTISHVFSHSWSLALHLSGPKMSSAVAAGTRSPTE